MCRRRRLARERRPARRGGDEDQHREGMEALCRRGSLLAATTTTLALAANVVVINGNSWNLPLRHVDEVLLPPLNNFGLSFARLGDPSLHDVARDKLGQHVNALGGEGIPLLFSLGSVLLVLRDNLRREIAACGEHLLHIVDSYDLLRVNVATVHEFCEFWKT